MPARRRNSPKPRRPRTGPGHRAVPVLASASETLSLRHAFWEHMVRDMLTTLSVMQESHPHLFDGRMAALTHGGERIPISAVHPLFACGIPGTPAEQTLSIAVECSVFRLQTPEGEVFTLPVSEIRALHALSDDLVKTLEAGVAEAEGSGEPFGFAAFTSLAREQRKALPARSRRRRRPR